MTSATGIRTTLLSASRRGATRRMATAREATEVGLGATVQEAS